MSRAGALRRRFLVDRIALFARPLFRSVAEASLEDPRLATALIHYVALLASIVILGAQEGLTRGPEVLAWLVIVIGISGLRVMTAQRDLLPSTVIFDALAMAIFMSGTGAPHSPFYLLGLAGAWWAGHLRGQRSGLRYAVVFGAAYLALTLQAALADNALSTVVEQVLSLTAIAVLSDRFHGIDRAAMDLSTVLRAAPPGIEALAVREQLQKTLGESDVPVDVVLTAAQVGLTAAQAELLGYLIVGLSTNEIADAAALSEATVRYRLTRLYRALNVRGRRAAVTKAHDLGLAAWLNDRNPPNPA